MSRRSWLSIWRFISSRTRDFSIPLRFDQFLYLAGIVLILFLPQICWGIEHHDNSFYLIKYLAGMFRYLLVYAVILFFFKVRHALWLFLIPVLFYPLELGSIYILGSYLNAGIIGMILNTSRNEAVELAGAIMPVTIFSILVIASYIFFIRKLQVRGRLPLAVRASLVLISLAFVAWWEIDAFMALKSKGKKYEPFHNPYFAEYTVRPPLNIFHKTYKAFELNRRIRLLQEKNQSFTYDARKTDPSLKKEIYVLVIGESCRYANWGINGYERETSPFLSSYKNVLSFSKCYSNANCTSISLPLLLTGKDGDGFESAVSRKTFLTAFREAGFRTSWISNQAILSEEYSAILTDLDKMYDVNRQYDEEILPFLEKTLEDTASRQFIVINIMGNHISFNQRHPRAFDKYKPNLNDKIAVGLKDKEYFINSYDNSILYTDYVLSRIISEVENHNARSFVMYCADHGESLYDDNKDIFCHSSENPPVFQVHVPLFIWYSEQYLGSCPDKIAAMRSNKDKRIGNHLVMYSILEMAGISHKYEKPERSFANPSFEEPSYVKVLTPNGRVLKFR